jgi:hypothetical protein
MLSVFINDFSGYFLEKWPMILPLWCLDCVIFTGNFWGEENLGERKAAYAAKTP